MENREKKRIICLHHDEYPWGKPRKFISQQREDEMVQLVWEAGYDQAISGLLSWVIGPNHEGCEWSTSESDLGVWIRIRNRVALDALPPLPYKIHVWIEDKFASVSGDLRATT